MSTQNDEQQLLKQASEYRTEEPPLSVLVVAAAAVALALAVAIGVLWLLAWLGRFIFGAH